LNFVTDMVAIGDAYDFCCAAELTRHGIGAVLSLARIDASGVSVPHLLVDVVDEQPLSSDDIDRAVQFVRGHVTDGRRVLVHCRAGISRSPALVACFLHEHEGCTIDAALERVKAARIQAAPHKALVDSIRTHYDPGGTAAVIDLSANENPWGPSPRAARSAAAAAAETNRYPDGRGTALKKVLAHQLGVGPETIVLGNGSSEILEMTARAVLAPGDEAIIGWPSFPAYRQAVGRAGGTAILTPLTDRYDYDLEAMAERVSGRTRLIILGNPNNPTGKAIGRAALELFLDRLPPGPIVLLDEAYCDYANRSDFPKSLDYLAAGHPVAVARTFSKAHGLAGIRLGYAVAAEPLARRIDAQRQRFNTNSVAQAAAIAALEDREHLTKTASLNAEGREWLSSALSRLGLLVVSSEANFLMIRIGDGTVIAEKLKKAGVLVKTLDAQGMPDFIRVSVGTPDQNARFVGALHDALRHAGHPE